jgi:hypothetical protein
MQCQHFCWLLESLEAACTKIPVALFARIMIELACDAS